MNEMYSEVLEHLRRQHAMNTQEIHGKNLDNSYKYSYYDNIEHCTDYACTNRYNAKKHGADRRHDNIVQEDTGKKSSWSFSFIGKIFLFLLCVMLFSCYLYGGQDVKKGAAMAWNDMSTQITKLEEKEPAVKKAMGYVRKAYKEVKDFSKTYLNLGE